MSYATEKALNNDWDKLTEVELLGLVIGNEQTAEAIIKDFGGFRGIANQPLEKFLRYKGLGDAKIIRIAACFEIAKRIVSEVLTIEHEGKL